ncbi:MAG TPA: rod shape-determining protein MreC [Candidatus Sulfotelmatobacter sp.]|nr:rod shape-determining protein MreC [Candidatus Sulfotelmatobacter sp.]
MESVLGRYRNLIILVGVLFLQVLGLAVQVKTGAEKETRLIRLWTVGMITPFERGLVWVQSSAGNLWHNYFYLRGVRAENRELKEQIEQMRLEQVRLTEDATQAHRLQMLLAFKEQFVSKTVAAQVIGTSGSDLSRIVYIDKGENAGIKPDMAVITADGVVGKVLLAGTNEARVLLISDQTSGVGAILEKSRLQGVLRGTANGEIVLERVMSDEQVQPGETVLTSGGDQIFPKGLRVGTVTNVANGKDLFLNITIKPAANLGKLEEVLVLTEKQEREAVAEDNGRVRAADILAQRLPSVPDKPAGDPNAAGTADGVAKPATGTGTANATPKPSGTGANPPAGAIKSTAAPSPPNAKVTPKTAPPSTPTAATQKPKPVNSASTETKPPTRAETSTDPSIVEQKPAPPATQPEPPPQDNSPQ